MLQVCLHGRGGQGVVTASEMLAQTAFTEGHQVQAFPSFGSERTGAPVVAYCRIADRPITTHEPVTTPDAVIVQDPTLLHALDPFEGSDPRTAWAVVNTTATVAQLRADHPDAPTAPGHLATVPADTIVRLYLGAPKPSAAMLGAFAALTGQVTLATVVEVIGHRFAGRVAERNVTAARVAHQWVLDHGDDAAPEDDVTAAVLAVGARIGIADPTAAPAGGQSPALAGAH